MIKSLFDDLYKHSITNEYSKFCMNNYLVLNPQAIWPILNELQNIDNFSSIVKRFLYFIFI